MDPALLDAAVRDHAEYLGFAPGDEDFLWLAREALLAPLPAGWASVAAPAGAAGGGAAGTASDSANAPPDLYYVNAATGESTWDHPLDDAYRARYAALRREKTAREAAAAAAAAGPAGAGANTRRRALGCGRRTGAATAVAADRRHRRARQACGWRTAR